MVATSVIAIELQDSAWQKFRREVIKHQVELKSMPGQWGAVGNSIKKTQSAAAKLVAVMTEHARQFKKANTLAGKMQLALKAADRTVTSLGRGTASVAKNIAGATKSLLGWLPIMGILSGVMGAGGLFGIARLAQGVSTGQSESRRTGSTFGETKAAQAAYGNVVNVESVLAKINQARLSGGVAGGKPIFSMAGMKEEDWKGKSSAEILPQYLAGIKQKFLDLQKKTGGKAGLATGGTGLEEILDLGELTKLSTTNLDTSKVMYEANKKQLDLSEGTQNAWTKFNMQLQVAGDKLENIFIRALTPLLPSLMQFSDAVGNALKTLMNTGLVKGAIKGASEGITEFSKYLTSPEFSKDLNNFIEVMKSLVAIMEKITPAIIIASQYMDSKKDERNRNQEMVDTAHENYRLAHVGEFNEAENRSHSARGALSKQKLDVTIKMLNAAGDNVTMQAYLAGGAR